VIVGGIPPGRAFGLSRHDPLAITGRPWVHVALPNVAGLTRVVDEYLEGATGGDRLRGFYIDVGEASRDGLGRYTVDAHLVRVQHEVEIERVELLGSPRVDGRRPGQGLDSGIPADHYLILGDVIAAVAGLRVVRIAEARRPSRSVGIQRSWSRCATRNLPHPGDGPGDAERRGHDCQQDHRHDHCENIRDPMRSLHGWLRGGGQVWNGGLLRADRLWRHCRLRWLPGNERL
jgi:hypothetical protein